MIFIYYLFFKIILFFLNGYIVIIILMRKHRLLGQLLNLFEIFISVVERLIAYCLPYIYYLLLAVAIRGDNMPLRDKNAK